MLTLILGRTGTGKTHRMMEQLCRNGISRPQMYLVPEQYSHETERLLSRMGGDGVSLYAEVLSFTRLASRVFAQNGGAGVPVLDQGGRILLMHRAVKAVEAQLGVYAKPSRRPAFLEGLLATGDELKSYCVAPDALSKIGEELRRPEGEKLRDLGLILSAYDALVAQRAADPRDRLTRLADGLKEGEYLRGYDVYADCFVDFTPQERNVLRRILTQANSLTVALTCDDMEELRFRSEFEPVHRTVQALRNLSKECRTECRIIHTERERTEWVPELCWLEKNFYGGRERWEEPTDAVELVTASSPIQEAEYAAGRILELVRTQGYRWRDIGVTARTMTGWEDELEAVFARYGVPVYLNRMTDILRKPILGLITAALDTVSRDFEYDDVFRYLKTGLTDLTPDQVDELENYVISWNIRGSRWTTETPWSWHPDGYACPWTEEQRERVNALDGLRRQVASPLVHLKRSKAATGAKWAEALYDFLEEIQLPARLSARAEVFEARGQLNRAEEYVQLWEILCNALEQCSSLLRDDPMELAQFAQLFQLVLSQYDVGAIPVALDRVTVGDAPRMAHKNLKCLIVLGAEDSAFPQQAESAGLLSDEDRAILADCGCSSAPNSDARMERELTIVYELLSLPRERLIVLHSESGATGGAQRPSFLFERLRALFPEAVSVSGGGGAERRRLSAPVPALEYAAEHRDGVVLERLKGIELTSARAERLEQSFSYGRTALTPEGVSKLYSKTIRLSASKMDKLKKCHLSYFFQYGLKAKQRKQMGFQAPEAGTFVHYVLEQLLKNAKAAGGVKACDEETIHKLTQQAVSDYIEEELGGLQDKPKRFLYLFRRLRKSVDAIVANVLEELRQSEFQPMEFELGFGSAGQIPVVVQAGELTLSITGFVDRVDGWYHNGRLYFRVVDYKTGRKSFQFTEIWNGLGLQMLIYLFVLEQQGILSDGAVVPSGVMYLPAREVVFEGLRSADDREKQKAVNKKLVRSGLLLDDAEVLEAMEPSDGTGYRFLPIVVKGKKLSTDYLASAGQLGELKKHLDRVLQQIGREFASGNVDADPYWHGDSTACTFCEFAAACHFEEGEAGCHRRYTPPVKPQEFWDKLRKQEEKEGT